MVARSFVHDLVRDIPRGSSLDRKGLCTDQVTSVTHRYAARQSVNGIEVADGDININEQADAQAIQRDVNLHFEDCRSLEREIANQL